VHKQLQNFDRKDMCAQNSQLCSYFSKIKNSQFWSFWTKISLQPECIYFLAKRTVIPHHIPATTPLAAKGVFTGLTLASPSSLKAKRTF